MHTIPAEFNPPGEPIDRALPPPSIPQLLPELRAQVQALGRSCGPVDTSPQHYTLRRTGGGGGGRVGSGIGPGGGCGGSGGLGGGSGGSGGSGGLGGGSSRQDAGSIGPGAAVWHVRQSSTDPARPATA